MEGEGGEEYCDHVENRIKQTFALIYLTAHAFPKTSRILRRTLFTFITLSSHSLPAIASSAKFSDFNSVKAIQIENKIFLCLN